MKNLHRPIDFCRSRYIIFGRKIFYILCKYIAFTAYIALCVCYNQHENEENNTFFAGLYSHSLGSRFGTINQINLQSSEYQKQAVENRRDSDRI